MRNTLSLVMIVKNEAVTLRRCLSSSAKLVDEIIVVDTGSTDDTKKIAAEYGANLYDFVWTGDFSSARNFALERSSCAWSLVLDADEYISDDCNEAIRTFIQGEPAIGRMKRIDAFQGTDGIDYEQIYISRIFPSSCRYSGKIHEQIDSSLPRKKVNVEIQHDGYLNQTKSDRNIPILLEVIEDQPNDPYYHYQIAKEYRGLEKHEQCYNHLKQAYKLIVGTENYAPSLVVNYLYAIMSSGNLEDGIRVVEEQNDHMSDFPDFYFVAALYLLELISSDPDNYGGNLPLIEHFYQRALEIGESDKEGSVKGTGSFAAYHNLGVFYEVTGQIEKAKKQYESACSYHYIPSQKRLVELNKYS